MAVAAAVLATLCVISHTVVIVLLSIRRKQLSLANESGRSLRRWWVRPATTQRLGLLSAILTLWLPYTCLQDNTLVQPGLRCICFFHSCKILDLSLAKSSLPPKFTEPNVRNATNGPRQSASTKSTPSHTRYIILLLTEMRYQSFDIAATQPGRPTPLSLGCFRRQNQGTSSALQHVQYPKGGRAQSGIESAKFWTYMPVVVIPLLLFLSPTPCMKSLFLLLIIQQFLESLHTVVHFNRVSCKQSLFYIPFAAASFTEFWSTHWHSAASPFLQSLAYKPFRKTSGKSAGVLATFALTGVWHAWAAVPIVEGPAKALLGLQVWSLFMVMGVGILVESLLGLGGPRSSALASWAQWIIVWSISLGVAGWCMRTVECHSKVDFLRTDRCED